MRCRAALLVQVFFGDSQPLSAAPSLKMIALFPLELMQKPLEQPVQEELAEIFVVSDSFVELEVSIYHVLQAVAEHMVKREACILFGVGAHAELQSFVAG